jgi:hypothetical protein
MFTVTPGIPDEGETPVTVGGEPPVYVNWSAVTIGLVCPDTVTLTFTTPDPLGATAVRSEAEW